MLASVVSLIIRIWDWLIIDFDRVNFYLCPGGFRLQFQAIPLN
jgi:hypothetical protein